MSAKIENEKFQKSLKRLEDMAKGQLYHTPASSEPGTWAGSTPEKEESMSDQIENGTDLDSVKKSIVKKLEKGEALSPAERLFVKSYMQKGEEKPSEAGKPGEDKDPESVPATHAGSVAGDKPVVAEVSKSEDEDEEEKMDKSLADGGDAIKGGIELSPFLAELVSALDSSLQGNAKKMAKSVAQALAPITARLETLEKAWSKAQSEDTEFKKGLAEAVVGIGAQVSGTAELVGQVGQSAARAPKSQLRAIPGGVQAVQKSFGGEYAEEGLVKSQAISVMTDLVKANKLAPLDVIKFESTGEMSAQTQQLVYAAINGGSR